LNFLQRFSALVGGVGDAQILAKDLENRLSDRTLATERDLVSHMDRVIRVTSRLSKPQHAAIQKCVELMCYGMPRFQFNASLKGLEQLTDLDDYCYYVAGVVGEMLTELFCSYSAEIGRQRAALSALAASFAQGLQMTNILKDVWEDRSRGACWLPQEVFNRYGVDLAQLNCERQPVKFAEGMAELVGIAHAHLRNALDYTLLIPPRETGIRRFCLWAIGLAILTLRKIAKNPGFSAGSQVKVTRTTVSATVALSNLFVGNDWMLKKLFEIAARGVPLGVIPDLRRPRALQKDALQMQREAEHAVHGSYRSSGT
jgi:farnesyl-diphosphate farnesyltransferase